MEPTRDLIVVQFTPPIHGHMVSRIVGAPVKERILFRLWKGDPEGGIPPCDFNPETCWPWPGARNEPGYGKIGSDPGGEVFVHRVVFREFVGPIPESFEVEHSCHTQAPLCFGGRICPHRACCNPNHLDAVDVAENRRRRSPQGKRGEECGHASVERGCRLCYNRQQREWRRAREARRKAS